MVRNENSFVVGSTGDISFDRICTSYQFGSCRGLVLSPTRRIIAGINSTATATTTTLAVDLINFLRR